ncbi:hypothetical protein ABVT39_007905 [Epinephelus coioides]
MVQRVVLQTLFKSKPCRISTPASGEASDAIVGRKFILQGASQGFQYLLDDGADSLAPNLISEWQDEWKIRQELVQCRWRDQSNHVPSKFEEKFTTTTTTTTTTTFGS